eukprot:7385805-Prymnesium_polylepis.1
MIPRHLVDLEAKLDVLERLALAHLDQRDVVLLVADGDVLPVGAPPDVDVLAARLDRLRALGHARVPDAHRLVARCRTQHVRLDWVPPQLVDRVLVPLELRVLRAPRLVERPHAHALVDRARGQLAAGAVPRDGMHLLLVPRVLADRRARLQRRHRALCSRSFPWPKCHVTVDGHVRMPTPRARSKAVEAQRRADGSSVQPLSICGVLRHVAEQGHPR